MEKTGEKLVMDEVYTLLTFLPPQKIHNLRKSKDLTVSKVSLAYLHEKNLYDREKLKEDSGIYGIFLKEKLDYLDSTKVKRVKNN